MSDAIFLGNRVGDVRFGRDFGRSAFGGTKSSLRRDEVRMA